MLKSTALFSLTHFCGHVIKNYNYQWYAWHAIASKIMVTSPLASVELQRLKILNSA